MTDHREASANSVSGVITEESQGAVRIPDELRSDEEQSSRPPAERARCMLVVSTSDRSCQQVNNFHSVHAYRGGCGRLALCGNEISLRTSLWLSNIMTLHAVQHFVYILNVTHYNAAGLSLRVDLSFAFVWTSAPVKSMSAGCNS